MPAAAATTPSAIGRGARRTGTSQMTAAERSSCAPSRRALSRSTGLGQRIAHSTSSRAELAHAARAARLDREARVGLGHQPLAGADERGDVGQPVGDRLLEPERMGVGPGGEARVGEQQGQRVHG